MYIVGLDIISVVIMYFQVGHMCSLEHACLFNENKNTWISLNCIIQFNM